MGINNRYDLKLNRKRAATDTRQILKRLKEKALKELMPNAETIEKELEERRMRTTQSYDGMYV